MLNLTKPAWALIGTSVFVTLAVVGILVYTHYDRQQFDQMMAELKIDPDYTPLPPTTIHDPEKIEIDAPFDSPFAIDKPHGTSFLAGFQDGGGEHDADASIKSIAHELARRVETVMIPDLDAALDEYHAAVESIDWNEIESIRATNMESINRYPHSRYAYKRMQEGATWEEVKADPEYQRLRDSNNQ